MPIDYALMPRLESIYSQKKKKLVYATAQRKETVTTDDIARHISSHNSVFSEGTIVGLLRDAQRCIMEHLMAGDRVDLDELGAFYTTLASRGARTTEEFDTSLIKSVNLKWLPSKRMRTEIQQVELRQVPTRREQRKTVKKMKELVNEEVGSTNPE
ncbi:MAG: hypothetical protein IJ762_06025 [Bacteroidaceae bacterium]|nr:hypothetical protein [Bacteroidaceae bacterium]